MAAPKKIRGKIGVIGLGIIGTRVAANLRSAGHQVYVWSRTPHAAPNFLGSVVEVADLCDVVQLFISDDGALHEVIRTMAAALRPRHVVLCHATVSPEATKQAAGIVESQGARYLDAPFTGSKAAAQNRQLVYYIGGARPALEEVRPILEATSKAILHVGGIGDASVLKIATNMLTASTVQTLAEALAIVRAAGIDGSKLVEALENNGSRSGTSDLKLPAMIAANAEPNFSLKHMLKDVRFAQELADKYELSLPLTDTTAEVLSLAMQNDWGDQDFSVVAQLYPAPTLAGVAPAAAPALKPGSVAVVPTLISSPDPTPADLTPKPAAAPFTRALANKPDAVSAGRITAESKAPVPTGFVASETTSPAPVSKEHLAGLTLPPRPAADSKPASSGGPNEFGNKAAKPASVNELTAETAPAGKEGHDKVVAQQSEPGSNDEKGVPTPVDTKVDLGAADQPKKPALLPGGVPSLNAEEAAKREKKNTLQFVRDFFRTVPTERR